MRFSDDGKARSNELSILKRIITNHDLFNMFCENYGENTGFPVKLRVRLIMNILKQSFYMVFGNRRVIFVISVKNTKLS